MTSTKYEYWVFRKVITCQQSEEYLKLEQPISPIPRNSNELRHRYNLLHASEMSFYSEKGPVCHLKPVTFIVMI